MIELNSLLALKPTQLNNSHNLDVRCMTCITVIILGLYAIFCKWFNKKGWGAIKVLGQSLDCHLFDTWTAAFTINVTIWYHSIIIILCNSETIYWGSDKAGGSNYTGWYCSNFVTYLITGSAVIDKKVDDLSYSVIITMKSEMIILVVLFLKGPYTLTHILLYYNHH